MRRVKARELQKLKRRGPRLEPKLRVIIYTEGSNTEPHYFRMFASQYGNSLVYIKCNGGAGVPATLVDQAEAKVREIKRSKDLFARADQVWVVFDCDEHPAVSESIKRAEKAGIYVGFSNPCFEVWLLIHYKDFDAPDNRHEVQKQLAKFDSSFNPSGSKQFDYHKLSTGYARAVERARWIRQRRIEEGNDLGRPYTSVDVLTQVIVKNGRR